MTEKSKRFMGHYGLSYALGVPESQVREKIAELSEKQKRGLRIQQKAKAKVRQQREEERRERCFK